MYLVLPRLNLAAVLLGKKTKKPTLLLWLFSSHEQSCRTVWCMFVRLALAAMTVSQRCLNRIFQKKHEDHLQ